jgi:ATP-dependent Clp protease adapter protein ClpS
MPIQPLQEESSDTATSLGEPAKVILFNDEIHTFDEVINQILKAIKCARERAEQLTWEVHSKGKAAVFEGLMEECLKVSGILEEIGLHTQVEC